VSQGGPIDTTAWLLEAMLARSDKTLDLLPGGKARAARLTDLQIGAGAAVRTITLWAITELSTSPIPIWSDSNNKFFGVSFGLVWLPEAYANEQAKIEDAQAKAMAGQALSLAKSLVKAPAGPVAYTGVRLFDAATPRFLNDQTLVVDKGVITAVGARASVTVPAGAQVIDGRGKTLIPGMWDCHMHIGDDYTGLQELSKGGDVDPRSRQRRRAHDRPADESDRRRTARAACLSLVNSSTGRDRTPRMFHSLSQPCRSPKQCRRLPVRQPAQALIRGLQRGPLMHPYCPPPQDVSTDRKVDVKSSDRSSPAL
jgi:hypothetical protein